MKNQGGKVRLTEEQIKLIRDLKRLGLSNEKIKMVTGHSTSTTSKYTDPTMWREAP